MVTIAPRDLNESKRLNKRINKIYLDLFCTSVKQSMITSLINVNLFSITYYKSFVIFSCHWSHDLIK